jgi:hypothetical protein
MTISAIRIALRFGVFDHERDRKEDEQDGPVPRWFGIVLIVYALAALFVIASLSFDALLR